MYQFGRFLALSINEKGIQRKGYYEQNYLAKIKRLTDNDYLSTAKPDPCILIFDGKTESESATMISVHYMMQTP